MKLWAAHGIAISPPASLRSRSVLDDEIELPYERMLSGILMPFPFINPAGTVRNAELCELELGECHQDIGDECPDCT